MIDDLRVDHRSTSVRPVFNMIQKQATNYGAGDPSKNKAGPSQGVKVDEGPCPEDGRIAGEPDVSTYRLAGGELYAEDVDQHMAVLPDIVTPTAEVTIDDIQVGDPAYR